MTRELNVVSSDSHVVEPRDLWEKYIAREYRDRAPRIQRIDGKDWWKIDGMPDRAASLASASAGVSNEELKTSGKIEEFLTGGWDPHARIKDMDRDRVDGEVLYTSKFDIFRIPDVGLRRACLAAYNDWLIDYCSASPDRLYGISLVPLDDVDWAVAELRRTMGRGMRGACIPCLLPQDQSFGEARFDPFWAAAQELGAPLSLHVNTYQGPPPFKSSEYMVDYVGFLVQIMAGIAQFISSGVLQRFPGLKLVSAENDIGWAASYMVRIDHAYTRHRFRTGSKGLDMLPSEFFKRQVFLTFMKDKPGVDNRAHIGVDNLMWASDYPHSDSTWPHSQAAIDEQFAHIPGSERRKIICDNAKSLYNL